MIDLHKVVGFLADVQICCESVAWRTVIDFTVTKLGVVSPLAALVKNRFLGDIINKK